jgi:hypothetical protein
MLYPASRRVAACPALSMFSRLGGPIFKRAILARTRLSQRVGWQFGWQSLAQSSPFLPRPYYHSIRTRPPSKTKPAGGGSRSEAHRGGLFRCSNVGKRERQSPPTAYDCLASGTSPAWYLQAEANLVPRSSNARRNSYSQTAGHRAALNCFRRSLDGRGCGSGGGRGGRPLLSLIAVC